MKLCHDLPYIEFVISSEPLGQSRYREHPEEIAPRIGKSITNYAAI
jgi:hypothetical protein